jgi:antitoxin CptB
MAPGDLERRRLRWRARRGLLENDLIISRFLDRHEGSLAPDEVGALTVLLDLSDNDLLDVLLGRKEPAGGPDQNALRAVVARLRAV